MKSIVSILLVLISFIGTSQNLVMNPSFEEYSQCPDFIQQVERAKYVYNPSKGTPDYYNACSSNPIVSTPNAGYGYQVPKSGDAYVGLFHSYQTEYVKEYIQLSFSEVLKPLKKYHFSIYVNVAGNSGWSADFLHFKFVDTLIYYNVYLFEIMTPDVTVSNIDLSDPVKWVEVGFDYVAQGGEKYIIFGNFNFNAGTDCFYAFPPEKVEQPFAYFYFDDASIIEVEPDSTSVPTISIIPATCNQQGSASISNYEASNTYIFSPTGPTVNTDGTISGMIPGTSYTVIANDGSQDSDSSVAFSIDEQMIPPTPTVTSPQSFCGTASIADLMPSTSEYKWYNLANGGTVLPTNEILVSGTYYVSQTVDGCESERAMVDVVIKPLPNVTVSPNANICTGTTISLTASGADNYTWSPTNETNNSISVNPVSTTTYTVTGTSDGCSDTAVVTITVLNNPIASFTTASDTVFVPSNVNFTNTSSNANSYSWFLDSIYQTSANHFTTNVDQEGTYIITLIADNGVCPSDTTSKSIHAILLPSFVNPPNVFSPNDDGINDTWFFEGTIKSIIILNRWGNVVFSADKDFTGWDGKDKMGNACSDGVYFYQIVDDQGIVHTSFITLLR